MRRDMRREASCGYRDPMQSPAHHAPDARRELRAPPGANATALGALFALSLVFLFVSYCMSRALIGGFDTGVWTFLAALVANFFASIFLWWLVPFADSADIFWVHMPADRRARRGQCPHCGYPHEGRATCSECGQDTEPLAPWVLSMRPVRRLTVVLGAALIVGSLAGEFWMRLDESRFLAESAASPVRPFTRERAFPAGFARMTIDAEGVCSSEAWPADKRERGWQPADPLRRERGLGWGERREKPAREQPPTGADESEPGDASR